MKVLIVCSANAGKIAPFIAEQVDSIIQQGIEADYYLIKGRGLLGYLRNFRKLQRQIRQNGINIIHAHYGLSGLLANLQRKVAVITTFHGSDINDKKIRVLSRMAMKLSKHSIFISQKLAERATAIKNYSVIPCGVDPNTFFPMKKNETRRKLRFNEEEQLILFSGSFNNKAKNYALAKKAMERLIPALHLIELKGYDREEVNLLLNACDVALLTSLSEGSPQFIKEAMASNRPIVATNVGDIEWQFGGEPGCFLCSFKKEDVAEKIQLAIQFNKSKDSTNGRARILQLGLDTANVAERIIKIYNKVLSETGIGTATKS